MNKQLQTAPPQNIRDTDPNVLQRQASTPESSVWVTASAGTGKTKVLTDRVLRLLLPRENGQPGTTPGRILCLTFTKAGAGEMALRLSKTLAQWAVMPPDKLRSKLKDLQGHEPGKTTVDAARRLFAEVSDTPGGLNIMTIHSFCQSVLGRFPLEAGIPPHFTPLEESEAGALLQQARDRVMSNTPNKTALANIAATVNEEQFFQLVENIAGEREQLRKMLQDNFGIDGFYANLCALLDITPGEQAEELLQRECMDEMLEIAALRKICGEFARSKGKEEPVFAIAMQQWLDNPAARAANFNNWKEIFISSSGTPRVKSFPTKQVEQNFPNCTPILRAESERLLNLLNRLNAARCAHLTRDLITIALEITDEYQSLKQERAALDFDDLIFTTCALLEGRAARLQMDNAAAWVLYKLDAGLDHILVDEAQDTNPEQWSVVKALSTEFTSGLGARETERTIFVVGDEKQSIYSFQRASPREFRHSHRYLYDKITAASMEWNDIPLNISFRSTKSVLQAVDATFAAATMQSGVSETPVAHESFRRRQAGHVELWPLCTTTSDDFDPWTPPTQIIESSGGAAQLAGKIARQVKHWVTSGEKLESYGRTIQPGDVMILVRTRGAFFNQLAKALKDQDIPVSGADRMILSEQIAVEDLMAFARFALQPNDNLTLACILKSPLIGLGEDDLFALAYNRSGTLWQSLESSKHKDVTEYLRRVMRSSTNLRPFDFFTSLLQDKCPADDKSGLRAIQRRLGPDSLDPIDELLNAALDDEQHNPPSLQQFLQRRQGEDSQIRREMEEKGNFVRIMTVHGAKGLQAPIVILPDTIRSQRGAPSQADRRLLWPDKTGLPFPLWSPRKELSFETYDNALAAIDEKDSEEYRRLLYVAMTRAEDRLYIGGYTGKKAALPDSWYYSIAAGLQSIPEIETLHDGTLRLTNEQGNPPDKAGKESAGKKKYAPLPAWVFKPAPQEDIAAKPLRPSRADDESLIPVNSPLQSDGIARFRRGNLTHKLLEILPGLPVVSRERAATQYLERFASDLSAEIRQSIAQEVMKLLTDKTFADIFGPDSLAEVPVTGKLSDGRVISGQIDRLLVTADKILIVDYKTNRPPPADVKDVPQIYRNQMAAYADVLRQIYPGKPVACALLWTDGARLMELPTP